MHAPLSESIDITHRLITLWLPFVWFVSPSVLYNTFDYFIQFQPENHC